VPSTFARLRRFAAAVILLSLPAAILLGGLVAFAGLNPWLALLGFMLVSGGMAILVRPYLADLSSIATYANQLADRRDAPVPKIHNAEAGSLAAALACLDHVAASQRDQLAARVAANEAIFDAVPDSFVVLDRGRHPRRRVHPARLG